MCAVQLCTFSTVSCWCLYSSLCFDLHRLGKSCCVKLLTYTPRGKQIARNAVDRLPTDATRCFMIHLCSFIHQLFGNVKKNKPVKHMSRSLGWYCFPGFGWRFFNNNRTRSQRQVDKTIATERLAVDKTSFCLRGSAEKCQQNAKAEYYITGPCCGACRARRDVKIKLHPPALRSPFCLWRQNSSLHSKCAVAGRGRGHLET